MGNILVIWLAYHGGTTRSFRSFENAERWARKQVASLDDRGFSNPADIFQWGVQVAEVRMSGDGRVWTDINANSWLSI